MGTAPEVDYCREVLLPIWERWTDGNLAMRRALDCESADPLTHEEYRNRLFQAQQVFHGRGETPDNLAASIAAQAVQYGGRLSLEQVCTVSPRGTIVTLHATEAEPEEPQSQG